MTAREYLGQYRQLKREIDSKADAVMRLYSRAQRMTQSLSGMPRGGHTEWTEYVDAIIDSSDGIAERVRELKKMEAEITRAIDEIPYSSQRQCLWRRYIQCESWPHIAQAMSYSLDGVYKLHRRALKNIRLAE